MAWKERSVLNYFLALNQEILSPNDLDEILLGIAKLTAAYFDLSLVQLFYRQGTALVKGAEIPESDEPETISINDPNYLVSRVAATGKAEVIQPVRRDSRLNQKLAVQLGLTAAVAHPLGNLTGPLSGVLVVGSSTPRFRFSREALDMLQLVAIRLAQTIDAARKASLIVQQRNEIESAHERTLRTLSALVEYRDDETGAHSRRVTHLAVRMARAMGLPPEAVEAVRLGALLHDIGKVGVPDQVLLKPGKLDEAEWAIMKTHPLRGWQLARQLDWLDTTSLNIIRFHHERWDGKGYPDGLARLQIPLEARLFAVIDSYDALRSSRPYRGALTSQEALAIVADGVDSHYCRHCYEVFAGLVTEAEALYEDANLDAAAGKTPSDAH